MGHQLRGWPSPLFTPPPSQTLSRSLASPQRGLPRSTAGPSFRPHLRNTTGSSAASVQLRDLSLPRNWRGRGCREGGAPGQAGGAASETGLVAPQGPRHPATQQVPALYPRGLKQELSRTRASIHSGTIHDGQEAATPQASGRRMATRVHRARARPQMSVSTAHARVTQLRPLRTRTAFGREQERGARTRRPTDGP